MREVEGNWGTFSCRIVSKTTRRGSPRWRYEIDREFAGIVDRAFKGRWRKTEAEARAEGAQALDAQDTSEREGEYL